MESVTTLWKEYNESTNKIHHALGRTNNIVGEYAEDLANKYIGGNLLAISSSSADIEKDGVLYQVKSRRMEEGAAPQLGVIRSWDFDYLVVILFNKIGDVEKAIIVPTCVAKENATENTHQNGYIITAHRNFLNCRRSVDITDELKRLNAESVPLKAQVLTIQSRKFKKLHKIKIWSKSPQQNNHRLIKAYLDLAVKGLVSKEEMKLYCSDPIVNPGCFVEKVTKNFNSMKTDAGNSNGKVFFEDNGTVFIFPQVMDEIKKYFPFWYFKNNWPFDKPEDHLVTTIKDIVDGVTPILYINHYEDDHDWLFTNFLDPDVGDVTLVPMSEIAILDPSVADVAYMKPGYHAWRNSIEDGWVVEKYI